MDVWHDGEWVVGTIIAKRSNGSKFDIIYDDGDEENDVDPLFMRFEMKETPRRATDQVKVLSDENLALTMKYNKLKEENEKIRKISTGAKDSMEIIQRLKQSIVKLERELHDSREEIETLKQEKESHIRLIDELSREQRSTIKAGTRKNVRSRTKRVRSV